jgi:bifunctional non-homologous end joining protein LigD
MSANRTEPLSDYRRKRDFKRTPEPAGETAALATGQKYVMHWHAASHDHYDLRLEQDGVLRSWALPKGPSLKRGEKRLAVEVEDHPLDYGQFEGTIPKGEYGGGTVMLWDEGKWQVTGKCEQDQIDFALDGTKLKGRWTLVRTRPKPGKPARNWLLIKRGSGSISKDQAHDRSIRSGRSMPEIARGAEPADASGPVAAEIPGARRQRMPARFSPQLATRASAAPDGDEWVHEIKFDGYRIIMRLRRGQVRLCSRNGQDYTQRFAAQAERLRALAATDAILDGEMVAMAADGATSFRELQERISTGDTGGLVLKLFDLAHLDGHDLTAATLLNRKQALQQLLAASGLAGDELIQYSDHVVGRGQEFYEHACELGLEGSIAKRADARYTQRRSKTWLKLKCPDHDDFLVGGFTPPQGSRKGFGALLLGSREGDALRYAGRVGSGFNARQLQSLHTRLGTLAVRTSPFADAVPNARGAVWVKPEITVKVEFTERTRDGHLRHPTFRAVRESLVPPAAPRQAQGARSGSSGRTHRSAAGEDVIEGIRISNPNRIVYPEQGLTKLELARYYSDVQDWLLPFLANRLLSLMRCPQGSQEACFFQKHLSASQARNVPRHGFRQSQGIKQYAYVQSIAHVIALVQAGVLEFHPFGSLVKDPERPDLMVFDLDPSPGIPWTAVLATARELKQRLADLELPSFVRTTGGKGLHVVVPLRPTGDWDSVKAFSKAVSERHAADDPEHLTTIVTKAKRRNKIYIDYLRNARGATAIACYSTRARPGAPVAVPLRWDELKPSLQADHYTVGNLRRRLGSLREVPWGDFYEARVAITAQMRKAVGLR